MTVGQDVLYAFCGIFGVARDISASCLHHTKDGEQGSRRTWQQEGYTTARLDTTLAQSIGDAVGHDVHLAIGIGGIAGYQSLCLRLFLSIVWNSVVVVLKQRRACGDLAQMTQRLLLLLADDGELANLGIGGCHHALNNCCDALCQRCRQSMGVERIVVLYQDAARLNLDVDLKLRHIQFEQLLTDRLTTYGVLRQYTHLIGVSDGWNETIVGGDACEGIVLMAQCLVECVADLMQIICHRHVVDLQTESKGVHEHTYRIGNLEVRTSITDGTEINLTIVGVARDDVGHSSEI